MPRKKLIRTDLYPYHVYGRANNKEIFYIPLCDVWRLSCELFDKVTKDYGAQVHAFVLMPNHYHLLMSTCLLYTSPSPRDRTRSRMPSSA